MICPVEICETRQTFDAEGSLSPIAVDPLFKFNSGDNSVDHFEALQLLKRMIKKNNEACDTKRDVFGEINLDCFFMNTYRKN